MTFDGAARRVKSSGPKTLPSGNDAVWVLVGLVLAALVLTWATPLRRWAVLLAALVAAQGALGYWQYFHGVPPLAVAFHVAGATAVFTTAVWLQLRSWRAPRPAAVPAASVASPVGS